MSYFLSSLPVWLLIAVIVVIPTALAMGAQALIHRRVGVAKLAGNNEIAGFKFATVGVIYAVLLAFTVIVVCEKFNDAQSAVADEAGATAALFRYAQGKEPEAVAMRTALTGYLKAAIEDDWPAMAREAESPGTVRALDALYGAAIALNRSGFRGIADMEEVFRQLDNVTAARRTRLHLATGLVPNVIWIVLFMGALNRRLHALLRQRESARASLDDRHPVGARHHGPGRDHLDRPSLHRPGLHPSGRARSGPRG